MRRHRIVIAIDMATTIKYSRIIISIEKLRVLPQGVSSCLHVYQEVVKYSTAISASI